MLAFVLRRIMQIPLLLFGICTVSFFMMKAVPGDPVRALLGPRATAESVAFLRAKYGLDEPMVQQFFLYVKNLVNLDFGSSITLKQPVVRLIAERIGPTLALVAMSTGIAILVSLLLAFLAARRPGSFTDRIIRAFATVSLGAPQFWLGVVLIILFSVRFKVFPVSGIGPGGFHSIPYLILPSLTLALPLSAILVRVLRVSYIDGLRSNYSNFARSKGASELRVFWQHVFRNSLVPSVQLLGVEVGWLIGGTVVVENVFAIPGLGELLVSSIFRRDYLVVQALTMFFAVAVVLINLVVDILSAVIDPRVAK